MKTKERILETALSIFNARGVEDVTVRDIAAKMGISHGNLCYHYPNKNDIIQALYLRLVHSFDELVKELQTDSIDVVLLLESNSRGFGIFYQYRFLFLDFTRIMRSIPAIKKHYRQLISTRRKQMSLMVRQLVDNGELKQEVLPGQYNALIEHTFIFSDFWIPSSEILYEGKAGERLTKYKKIFHAIMIPYLTSKGLRKFSAFHKAPKP